MPEVGDRIELVATKVSQAPRTGVVTDVRGRMITVRWPSGDQSLVVPAPGTLTVIGREGAAPGRPKARGRPSRSTKAAESGPASMTPKRTVAKADRKRSSAGKVPAKKAAAKTATKVTAKKVTAKKPAQNAPVPKTAKRTASKKAAQKRGR